MPVPDSPTSSLTTLEPLFLEIQLRILSFAAISPSTLSALTGTCRAWHAAYMPLLYEHAALNHGNAKKFFYGMGGQYGPPSLASVDARRWLERMKRRRSTSTLSSEEEDDDGPLGEHGKEASEERQGEAGAGVGEAEVWGMDSYWDQTPDERLQTRINLVRRLDILDGEACLQVSNAMGCIQNAITSPLPGHLVSGASLFPSCRSVVLREELIIAIGRDPGPYLQFEERMGLGNVPLSLAGSLSDVHVFFSRGLISEMGLVADIIDEIATGADLALHNLHAEDAQIFGFGHGRRTWSYYLQPPTPDDPDTHACLLPFLTRIRNNYR
ncbi:hypothetical protein IAT38_006859 [Cryptococcus sp. DSM 104549]